MCDCWVSIPPRKVSRAAVPLSYNAPIPCFHSTKEGFKVNSVVDLTLGYPVFPFHQGRFQGGMVPSGSFAPGCFHSTKEGFKGGEEELKRGASIRFPFHQGRFQGHSGCADRPRSYRVSIPPRKVSRTTGRPRRGNVFSVSIPPRKVSR